MALLLEALLLDVSYGSSKRFLLSLLTRAALNEL